MGYIDTILFTSIPYYSSMVSAAILKRYYKTTTLLRPSEQVVSPKRVPCSRPRLQADTFLYSMPVLKSSQSYLWDIEHHPSMLWRQWCNNSLKSPHSCYGAWGRKGDPLGKLFICEVFGMEGLKSDLRISTLGIQFLPCPLFLYDSMTLYEAACLLCGSCS